MEGGEEVQLIDSLNDRAFAIVEDGIYFIPGRRELPFTPSVRTSIQFYSFADGSVQRLVLVLTLAESGSFANKTVVRQQRGEFT